MRSLDCRKPGLPSLRLKLAEILWGWHPHPTQRKWLLDDSDIKVAACGRRWGKTEAESVDAATYAICHPGSEQVIVAPTYDQARLIASGVERLAVASSVSRKVTAVKKTPYPVITIGASRIAARSADDEGRGLRGHRADRVIVDEAAFVRDQVINEVIQPMLADSAGQLILISTPFGRNYFWRMFTEGQKAGGRVRSFRFPSSDNPHISRAYIEAQQREIPERAFRTEYLAEFCENASQAFAWSDIDACIHLEPPEPLPGYSRVVAGVDWARYGDYTVCLALETSGKPWKVVSMDRFQGLSWESSVRRAARFIDQTGAESCLADSTSVGDPLLEQLETALRSIGSASHVEGLVFTTASKRDIIDHLCLRLSHRDLCLSLSDPNGLAVLLGELQAFEYRLQPSGLTAYCAPSGRHDDCVIALALAAWQAREAPVCEIVPSSALGLRASGWSRMSYPW